MASKMLTFVKNQIETARSEDPQALRRIADGAGVGVRWLQKVLNGDIPDPGVNRIELLRDYLVGGRKE